MQLLEDVKKNRSGVAEAYSGWMRLDFEPPIGESKRYGLQREISEKLDC
jgi:hypothetical protein